MIKNYNKYFATYFKCPNKHFGCFHEFPREKDLKKHFAVCVDPKVLREQTESESREYSQLYNQLDTLITRGILRKPPTYRNHIQYDCESLMTPLDTTTRNTEHLFEHRLVSVACNAYINSTHEAKCWVVKNDSDDEQKRIVGDFVEYVLKQAEIADHDSELVDAIEKHEEAIEAEEEKLENNGKKQNWSSPYLGQLRKDVNFMKTYLQLPLFGYNSSRYDMKMLIKLVIESLEDQDQCEGLSMLKKAPAISMFEQVAWCGKIY